jgi:hypothetical protein
MLHQDRKVATPLMDIRLGETALAIVVSIPTVRNRLQ